MRLVPVIALILLIHCIGFGQTVPPLERKVTLSFQNTPVEAALNKVSEAANFNFSYSPSVLNANLFVSGKYSNAPVREILIGMLGESIEAKGKGNHVILTKMAAPTKKEVVKKTVIISGYVTDKRSGQPLSEVSVYEKRTLTAVITNEFGFYKITVDDEDLQTVLFFSKRSFLDTLLRVSLSAPHFINITMTREAPLFARIDAQPDTIPFVSRPPATLPEVWNAEPVGTRKKLRDRLQEKFFSKEARSKKEGKVNANNIKDTLHRDVQVSLLPFIGTNHKLSGNIINGYSFNILGGYAMGTRRAELGGLFNVDRGDVSYAQLAGLFNVVGGRTNGVQIAGLINLDRKKVTGIQYAGLINANLDSVHGGQFAGLFNVNGRASDGVQFAGLFNVQPAPYRGPQFAGLFNVATHHMKGTQVAGLMNFAHHIKGAQIGLFNYADSIKGIPLGLLSVVSHGYHKIEFSADEVFYANASFRTGVQYFYNILNVGFKPETWNNSATATPSSYGDWSFGYGVGTAPKVTKWLYLNFDFTGNHVNKGNFTNSLSLLNKVYFGLDFQVLKKVSLTAGVTLNAYLSNPAYADNPVLFTDFSPRIFSEHNFQNGNNMKMWWGAKVGIRFL